MAGCEQDCEKVLDIDPKNAEAYLGKLMADLQVRSRKQLADCAETFDNRENYSKVLRFGDEKLETEMRGYISHINERNENARLTGIYNGAVSDMNAANSEATYKAAAYMFQSISGFHDADALAEQCLDKAEVCRKNAIYTSAHNEQIKNSIAGCNAAIRLYESISGWKDADKQIYACRKKIEEIKAKEESDRLERERQAEQKRIAAEKAAKKRKKIAIIVTPIVVACIAFLIVLTTVIIPNGKYNDAINLIEKGDIINAYESLIALNGYKDSAEKAKEIFGKIKTEKLKTASVGDMVYFGAYEQDNNTSNGKEDIEWLVLEKEGNKALVISMYALDCQQYNTSHTDVTWETCSLRKWLNGTFLSAAFSSEEQSSIISSTVTADKNPSYSTSPGNNATDKVFLLSITEVKKYFNSDRARLCGATAYAKAQGAYTDTSNGKCFWWLRSPGCDSYSAARVNYFGSVIYSGYGVFYDGSGVRPALWINLGS